MSVRPPPTRRAFTLVELITVIVILAIVAGLVVPRLVAGDDRRARGLAESVADLLSRAAAREALSGARLALDFSAKDNTLRVMTLRVRDPRSFAPGEEEWLSDALSPTVDLDGLELVAASAAGLPLDVAGFRWEFPRAGERPPIMLLLGEDVGGRDRGWVIALPAGSVSATVTTSAGLVPGSAVGDPVDLDAAGRRDEPW